jgi:hypothetical protein
MNTKASTPATAIAKAGARPIRVGRDRRRHARFLSILMNRYFLFAVIVALVLVVAATVGLAVFAPTPAQHHVETVLPNDRFQPAH